MGYFSFLQPFLSILYFSLIAIIKNLIKLLFFFTVDEPLIVLKIWFIVGLSDGFQHSNFMIRFYALLSKLSATCSTRFFFKLHIIIVSISFEEVFDLDIEFWSFLSVLFGLVNLYGKCLIIFIFRLIFFCISSLLIDFKCKEMIDFTNLSLDFTHQPFKIYWCTPLKWNN